MTGFEGWSRVISTPSGTDAPVAGADGAGWNLDAIVSGLRLSREITHNIRRQGRIRQMPSRDALAEIVGLLAGALFPSHYGHAGLGPETIDYFVGHTLHTALPALQEQIRRALGLTDDEADPAGLATRAGEITRALALQLPKIRDELVSDLRAAFTGDPAAANFPEIMLGYPGMTATLSYRLAHALHGLGAPFIARLVSEIAHSRTGIDIHPAAEIGESFFIDHGTGVVIGETAIIGKRVRLYQAVTLGARSFPADASGALVKGQPRHPILEDDVVVYAGATILGRITVGRGSTIGGNVWLTRSVPPGSTIVQASHDQPDPVTGPLFRAATSSA